MLTSPAARSLSAAAALLLALVGSVVLAAPAAAAEKVVSITAEGLSPRSVTIAAGDTVVLVNDDAAFRYRATSTTENWSFDSGPLPLAPGQRYALPEITESGTYGFTVFQGDDPFNGTVVLPAPGRPAPAASPSKAGTSPRPAASSSAAPAPATSASASSAPTGGSGSTALNPGGFGAVDTVPSPPAGGVALPPDLAPQLAPGQTPGPAPQTAGEPSPAPLTSQAVRGDLPGAGTSRGLGLPAALAAVLAAGVASLLVRLLLSEPAARAGVSGLSGPDPVATVD